MTAKSQTNWPPEKLEEWARPALAHRDLVEIARTATGNNEAKEKALFWVTKTHESLAQACRWLHILRANYPERFEKLISQVEQNLKQEEKKVEEKKDICKIEFGLPHGTELVTKTIYVEGIEGEAESPLVRAAISFHNKRSFNNLLGQMLSATIDSDCWDIVGYNPFEPGMFPKERLRDLMIQIFKEKYGLKIKICENCMSYRGMTVSALVPGGNLRVTCLKRSDKEDLFPEILSTGCVLWEPKEFSEK